MTDYASIVSSYRNSDPADRDRVRSRRSVDTTRHQQDSERDSLAVFHQAFVKQEATQRGREHQDVFDSEA